MHNLALNVLSSLGEEPNGKIFMKALYNLKKYSVIILKPKL